MTRLAILGAIPFVVNPNLSAEIVVSVQDMDKPLDLKKMLVDGLNEAFLKEIRVALEVIGASEDDPRKEDALKALEDLRKGLVPSPSIWTAS